MSIVWCGLYAHNIAPLHVHKMSKTKVEMFVETTQKKQMCNQRNKRDNFGGMIS